jgi:hypothetical protein
MAGRTCDPLRMQLRLMHGLTYSSLNPNSTQTKPGRMKRRTWLTGAIIAGCAAVGGLWLLSNLNYEVKIPQSVLQQNIEQYFPIEKKQFIIEVKIDNPKVILEDGSDRLKFGVDMDVSSGFQDFDVTGNAIISGKVMYRRDTGEFFLGDANIDKVNFEGNGDEIFQKFDQMANNALREFLDNQPLYKLDSNDIRQTLLKLTLKDVIIRDRNLILKMGVGF